MAIFYPIILVLGFFTSYTDLTFRKIRNKHLVFATILGLAAHIYLISHNKNFLNITLLSNVLLGMTIGLILYFTETWRAGDAKLFTVFCLLTPTQKYSQIFPLPAIAVFVNVFLISTLVILAYSIKQGAETKTPVFKKIFSLSTLNHLWESFIIIITLGWMAPPIIQTLIPKTTTLLYVIILYFFYHIIYTIVMKYFPPKHISYIIVGFFFLIRLSFQPLDFIGINLLDTFKKTISYTFVFHSLRTILMMNSSKDENSKHIPFAPLIFLGTLLANTNFLNVTMNILRTAR